MAARSTDSTDYVFLIAQHGSLRAAAAATGTPATTLHRRQQDQLRALEGAQAERATKRAARRAKVGSGKPPMPGKKAKPEKPLIGGQFAHPETKTVRLHGRRFILTSAQNNTFVHEGFMASLLTMAEMTGAQLLISRYTYNVNAWNNAAGVTTESEGVYYDPALEPYLTSDSIRLADDLVFCAEITKLPTAVSPLTGLDSYTGTSSGIVGHPKVAMQSMAGLKTNPPRIMYSTGTITQRNYVDRFAGQKAAFHHVFGALFVEIDPDGVWFARQLIATEDGAFQDLDTLYTPRGAWGRSVAAIVWGDIHHRFLEPEIKFAMFGSRGIYDTLKPRLQVKHDTLHFAPRSHHAVKDRFGQAQFLADKADGVEDEIIEDARFLVATEGDADCETIVPEANHNTHLRKWLAQADFRDDPRNARYGHYLSYRIYQAIEEGRGRDLNIYELAVREAAESFGGLKRTRFLKVDESCMVADLELGIHGDLGPNGARGSPKAFRQIGHRAVTGHTHTAGIVDGVYTVGVSASTDQGYNKGPSSWSQTHCVVYENGKRALITHRGARWRGEAR